MADETGLDFSDQIGALERKYQLVSSSVLDILFHVKLIFSRNRNFNGNKITSKMLVSDRPVKANEDSNFLDVIRMIKGEGKVEKT